MLIHPFLRVHLLRRLRKEKENAGSIKNKMGSYSKERPAGKLVWVHAASVGESKSILPVINYIRQHKEVNFLITTSTISGEAIVKNAIANLDEGIAKGIIHQFLVLDTPINAVRFFDYWHPNLGIFIDSEIWPNILYEAKKRLPMILLNGRISPSSFKKWLHFKSTFQFIMDAFVVISPTTEQDAEFFRYLGGGDRMKNLGNLKKAAAPLQYNKTDYNKVNFIRPVFLASSTHAPEEEQVLQAFLGLDIILVIALRHPYRGKEVGHYAESLGYEVQYRSSTFPPQFNKNDSPKLYIVDKIGELGMWYRLADVVFMGGSLIDIGGHNVVEPSQLKKAIIIGPYTYNFSESMNLLRSNNAVLEIADVDELKNKTLMLLKSDKLRAKMGVNAAKALQDDRDLIKRCSDLILEILDDDSFKKA